MMIFRIGVVFYIRPTHIHVKYIFCLWLYVLIVEMECSQYDKNEKEYDKIKTKNIICNIQ